MEDNNKKVERFEEEIEEVDNTIPEDDGSNTLTVEDVKNFFQLFLERPTLEEAIEEQKIMVQVIRSAFDELDQMYKKVLQNRIEFIHALTLNRVRLMSSKVLRFSLSPEQRGVIDKMMELCKKTRKDIVDSKETIDLVGVNLEKARKYEMIEYEQEFKALITYLNNKNIYIIRDYNARYKSLQMGLNGIYCSVPDDEAQKLSETEENISVLMRRLGIENKSA